DMDKVREVCSAALSLRKARGLRVRLPLPALTVAFPDADRLPASLVELVADEVNVKSVTFTGEVAAYCRQGLNVVPRALGPRGGAAGDQGGEGRGVGDGRRCAGRGRDHAPGGGVRVAPRRGGRGALGTA